jgi:hypothetical protein
MILRTVPVRIALVIPSGAQVARIRARLTDDDIAAAHEIAEAGAEALARYETRRR